MKSYLIRHIEGGYLYKGTNAKWERTQNINKAERMPHEKAANVLNNCIGPTMRSYWEIIEEDALSFFIAPRSTAKEDGSEFDWEAISRSQYQLYNELSRYEEELRLRLSEVDFEICDIHHYIEFFSLDAAKGYKAYRMLKERLERRRFIKDEMVRVNCFLSGSSGDFSSGKVDRQIKGLEHCK